MSVPALEMAPRPGAELIYTELEQSTPGKDETLRIMVDDKLIASVRVHRHLFGTNLYTRDVDGWAIVCLTGSLDDSGRIDPERRLEDY